MKKISVIIPVYNVESYIRKCLSSVVNQTYSNLEIICVNDGSTDGSGRICDEYAEKDSRIIVIHQKNGGNSSAMNTGLDLISGELVSFIDPDDWVEINFYEVASQAIEQYGVDFVCTGWFRDTVEESVVIRNKKHVEAKLIHKEQSLEYTFMRDVYPAFGAYYWNKLFRSEWFKGQGSASIRFDESMRVGADVVMFTEYVLKSQHGVYFETPYYHYFQRDTSLFHSKDINKRKGSLSAYLKVIDLLTQHQINTDIHTWVKRFYVYHASLLAELAIENGDAYHLAFMQQEMKRYITEYLETNKEYPERIKRIESLLAAQI